MTLLLVANRNLPNNLPIHTSKVQQFADFFLTGRNLRIEVIDVFENSRLKARVVADVRIGLENLQRVALVACEDVLAEGIDWLLHDSVIGISCYRLSVRHAQSQRDH